MERNIPDAATLLSPTLEDANPPEPIYSVRAQFFTAFFGGPFAIIGLTALNAGLLGRLKAESWRYGVAAVVSLAVVAGLANAMVAEPPPPWITDLFGEQSSKVFRWGSRAYALALWYVLYLQHRPFHKAAETMGLAPRTPWKAAGACIAAAVLLQIGITFGVAAIVK